MCPNECLRLLFEKYNAGGGCFDEFENLYNWLDKGGFPPVCNELPNSAAGTPMAVISSAGHHFECVYSLEELQYGGICLRKVDKVGKTVNCFDLVWKT